MTDWNRRHCHIDRSRRRRSWQQRLSNCQDRSGCSYRRGRLAIEQLENGSTIARTLRRLLGQACRNQLLPYFWNRWLASNSKFDPTLRHRRSSLMQDLRENITSEERRLAGE